MAFSGYLTSQAYPVLTARPLHFLSQPHQNEMKPKTKKKRIQHTNKNEAKTKTKWDENETETKTNTNWKWCRNESFKFNSHCEAPLGPRNSNRIQMLREKRGTGLVCKRIGVSIMVDDQVDHRTSMLIKICFDQQTFKKCFDQLHCWSKAFLTNLFFVCFWNSVFDQ